MRTQRNDQQQHNGEKTNLLKPVESQVQVERRKAKFDLLSRHNWCHAVPYLISTVVHPASFKQRVRNNWSPNDLKSTKITPHLSTQCSGSHRWDTGHGSRRIVLLIDGNILSNGTFIKTDWEVRTDLLIRSSTNERRRLIVRTLRHCGYGTQLICLSHSWRGLSMCWAWHTNLSSLKKWNHTPRWVEPWSRSLGGYLLGKIHSGIILV